VDEPIQREMIALLPRLRRFAYGLTGSIHDGDDLVQATCERAILKLDLWRPGTRLDSWMFRIAQNLHFNNLRDGALRRQHLRPIEAEEVADASAERVAEGRLTLDAVRRLMARLPAEQTAVVMLVCVEGLSYREAADILEVPVGTVMSRLARGRATLKTLFDGGTGNDSRNDPGGVSEG